MKLVILDGYCLNPGDLSWAGLEALGELTVYDRTPLDNEEEIAARIGGCEIVLTNKTPISRSVLDRCPQVRYIGLLATGYNVVDVDAARERNIPVCNVPGYGTSSVAQFAIALLLEICCRAGHHGSKYATSQALLDAVRPETACISVGSNSYGHPTEETLLRLARQGCGIYRTDLHGTIHLSWNQEESHG